MEDQANPWWAGAGFEVSVLDPFTIYADFNYGSIDQKDKKADVNGWLADLAVEYKGVITSYSIHYTKLYDNSPSGVGM